MSLSPQEISTVSTEALLSTYTMALGDDALILGHRLSEWCGHAPILEEDIALANIALDCVGQANGFLTLAASLEGKGRKADDLAFLRDASEFTNVQLVEQPNGDFAVTIVRQVFFDSFALPLFELLASASHAEFAGLAGKALKETRYHARHANEWLLRLGCGTEESARRSQEAVDILWEFTHELGVCTPVERELTRRGVIPDTAGVRAAGSSALHTALTASHLTPPSAPGFVASGSRNGFHTEHLSHLLAEMQVLQRSHPGASW